MFTTKKTWAAETAINKGYNASAIGFEGTVEELNAALKELEENTAIIKKAYKRVNAIENALILNLPKWQRLTQVLKTAQQMPDEMRQQFVEGSCAAFKDGRPENIQYIFSHPSAFLPKYRSEDYFIIDTLLKLMSESDTPDTVIKTAFADLPVNSTQEILDESLVILLDRRSDEDVTPQVSALLKAGANPGYRSSTSLALALHKEMPAKLVDLLLNNKKGASLEDALQRMRDSRRYYGDTPEKIEALQQKTETENRLREMEETIKELTRRLEENGVAPPSPASTEQAVPPKKRLKLGKPFGPQ